MDHQPWDGAGDVYVIGVVEIDDQPDIRLMTNIVGMDPAQLRIGMPVEVVFEDHDPSIFHCFDRWAEMAAVEQSAVISGIGQSAVGRRLDRDGLDLTIDAALEAIADARLNVGTLTAPRHFQVASWVSGILGPGSPPVQDALRLSVNWHSGGLEGPAQLQAVVNAVMAVAAGLARHVLVYRTVTEASAQGKGGRPGIGLGSAR